MKKPVILIEDECFNVKFDLSEPFTDSNMVEKYTSLQALIDMVYKPDDEAPNDTDSD